MIRKVVFILVVTVGMGIVANAKSKESANKADAKIGIEIGKQAPEIYEKSVDGEYIKLSSLRGKLVLIDFWASWCGPCRRENPNVVNVYNNYKDKKFVNGDGFTVYSVSLDKNHTAWTNSIQADNLDWEYHVSDLKGWYSKYANIYGVRSIPANFLIDENGIIIGHNLRGPVLENTIKKYLK